MINPAKNLLFLYTILSLVSCDLRRKDVATDAVSIDNMGTLYVIGNSATVKSVMEDLQKSTSIYQRYFAQPEPYFQLEIVPVDSFITKPGKQANYLLIKTDAETLELYQLHLPKQKNSAAKLSEKKDTWANPQTIHVLEGPDVEAIRKYLRNNGAAFREKLLAAERTMEMQRNKDNASDTIDHFLRNEFDLCMTIPNGFTLAAYREKDDHGFAWIRKEDAHSSQGLFIYTTPYEGKATLDKNAIIARRDSIGRWHVPGEQDSTWMSTHKQYVVQSREITIDGKTVIESRGVWQVANERMSGPFYSISFADESRGLIYTIEGFVYVPKYAKTPYLRQLEAMIHSLTF